MNEYRAAGEPFTFDGPRPPDADGEVPGESTLDALRKVELNPEFDLAGQRPYARLEVERVVLARLRSDAARADAIFAVTAAELPASAAGLRDEPPLGIVRPVQRYVRRHGIERARRINKHVLARLPDPWGFARLRDETRGENVSVTPPVLEQAHSADQDPAIGYLQLIVCDGNHRVVERVWHSRQAMAAVVVLGEPHQPYYAHPRSWLDWEETASNIRTQTPPQHDKYRVREVTLDRLSKRARALLERHPHGSWYRRYFRDLTKGFGDLGAQGGFTRALDESDSAGRATSHARRRER